MKKKNFFHIHQLGSGALFHFGPPRKKEKKNEKKKKKKKKNKKKKNVVDGRAPRPVSEVRYNGRRRTKNEERRNETER